MSPPLKEPQKSGRMGHNLDDNFVTGQPRSLTDIGGHISPEQFFDTTIAIWRHSPIRAVSTHVEDDGSRDQHFDSGTGIWKYLPIDA